MEQIEKLLALSIAAETTDNKHVKQVLKMKGGKLNKELLRLNKESLKAKSGVKLDN